MRFVRQPPSNHAALYVGAGGGGSSATFVGVMAWQSASAANQDVSIAGLSPVAGDLCIVVLLDNPTTTMVASAKGGGVPFTLLALGGTQTTYRWDEASTNTSGNKVKVSYLVLNGTAVSNGNLVMSGLAGSTGALIMLYRGATSVASAALPNFSSTNSTAAPGVTGFTPSGSTKGAVIVNVSRISGANGNLNVTAPTDWTTRANTVSTWTVGSIAMLDRLSGYAGGSITVNHTALGSGLHETAFMLELQ